jgi:uncharacterized protein (TIGR03435 family)
MMMHALVEHLWESTLFALAAGLATLALRNNAARVRYWLWFVASVKFLIPFYLLTLLGSMFHWRQLSAAPLGGRAIVEALRPLAVALAPPQVALRAPPAGSAHIGLILVSIWAAGCVVILARWVVQWARMRAILRSSVPAAIEAPIPVRLVRSPFEPGVIGILHPVLLLPDGIAERLTPPQMQAVIAHELCHIRRRDNLTATIHMVLEAVCWFHPLIWWIGARLVEERERACDEAVVELGNDTHTYAESILKVCQFYVESKLACVAGVSGSSLKRRVEVIMRNPVMEQLGTVKKVLLTVASAAVVVVPIAVGVVRAPAALAQAGSDGGATPVTFDTVSIFKAAGGANQFIRMKPDGTFSTTQIPLRQVIAAAYGVDKSRVVGGADWLDQPLYDISAHTASASAVRFGPAGVNPLKSMLAARFGLLVHPETQQLSAYVLRVAATGSKLGKELSDQERLPGMIVRPNLMMSTAEDMRTFSGFLAGQLGRPVVDETGLKGRYDFALTGTLDAETLPTMLREQLGLTVEPATTAVQVVVIDSVQPPTLDPVPTPTA